MPKTEQVFEIPTFNYLGSKMLLHLRPSMVRVGNFETALLRDRLAAIDTSEPIFVCGLARSGTTILIELLSKHRDVASQRYLDYPFIFVPYFWNRFVAAGNWRDAQRIERAHKDGLYVGAGSPEAMEEPIWMHFFPDCHDPHSINALGVNTDNREFESFYEAHIAKLLLVRSKKRYAAKGNYHIMRIAYLRKLYPNARFLIPVRDPHRCIESSIRQNRRFALGQEQNPRARLYLSQAGHFEFGLDRAPINVDLEATAEIMERWRCGDEIGGWTAYWVMIHDYIAALINSNHEIREQTMVIPYELLCTESENMAQVITDFCKLPDDSDLLSFAKNMVKAQDNYQSALTENDLRRITQATARTVDNISALFSSRERF